MLYYGLLVRQWHVLLQDHTFLAFLPPHPTLYLEKSVSFDDSLSVRFPLFVIVDIAYVVAIQYVSPLYLFPFLKHPHISLIP
jgi:hypothetical protein